MTMLVFVVAMVVTLAAAARSTWSPCGRSMLSTITPLAERGRGHRFGVTACWFVIGAAVGGLCLGVLGSCGAAVVGALHPSPAVAVWVGAAALFVGAGLDAGVGGVRLPAHHRQVDEWWLDRFRAGVYGLGFGWQIGCGLATYIMTAGVYLVVVLGALTGRPWLALALGGAFGAARGLAVLAGRRIRTLAELTSFHRRFDAMGEPSWRAMVAIEASAATALAGLAWPPLALVAGALVVGVAAARLARSRPARPSPARPSPARPSPGRLLRAGSPSGRSTVASTERSAR